MAHYIHYYEDQVGGGMRLKNVYSGSTYQRGRGVGSWLGGIIRKVLPYVGKAFKSVSKEVVRGGLNVLGDIANDNVNVKEAFLNRAKETGQKLRKKAANKMYEMADGMKGAGYYKMPAGTHRRQSRKSRVSKRISSRKKKKNTKKRSTLKKRSTKGKKKKKTKLRNIEDIFGPK